jgi:hypothetical protein
VTTLRALAFGPRIERGEIVVVTCEFGLLGDLVHVSCEDGFFDTLWIGGVLVGGEQL